MPRANRYIQPGYLYHITHRCHDRSFLLKFSQDRNYYRKWLHEAAARFKVSVLGYCVTCNHIHLVLRSCAKDSIGRLMHLLQSRSAQHYNWRKGRKGAYWEDRYSCTMIDSGRYLWNCLVYIDLNMVRAGKVKHPLEWEWCGYNEFMGTRKRYRILNTEILLPLLGYSDLQKARDSYSDWISKWIVRGDIARNPIWTGSLAVGNKRFVESIRKHSRRVRTYINEEVTPEGISIWSVMEERSPYT
ncbi:MAG: transposase [Chlamydiota bacterium]